MFWSVGYWKYEGSSIFKIFVHLARAFRKIFVAYFIVASENMAGVCYFTEKDCMAMIWYSIEKVV